jgi:deazaflavin-dependent oxidoreductase (nitroreductase family)
MLPTFGNVEKTVFRLLNTIVEPAVRRGIGSPSLTPASLIVLETIGFKSGERRRTPLWSFKVGRYRVVSTARGDRSFWVKNAVKQPRVSYYLGGRRKLSDALVIADGEPDQRWAILPPAMRRVAALFARLTARGWVFAILVPLQQD